MYRNFLALTPAQAGQVLTKWHDRDPYQYEYLVLFGFVWDRRPAPLRA